MSAPRSGELRLLCLHGYGQNAERFRARTGALRKAWRGHAELLYLDAPHRLDAEEAGEGAGPRGWWLEAVPRPDLRPALRTVARALTERGPVDGLLGFSQGAALAGTLCALRQVGDARFPFRFAVLVAGFPGPEAGSGGDPAGALLRVPSLHVFGEADRVIPAEQSRVLASRFARPVLLAHPGGHFVPAAAAQRAAYLDFLRRFEGPAGDEFGLPCTPTVPDGPDSEDPLRLSGEQPAEAADCPGSAPSQAVAAGGGRPAWEPCAGGLQEANAVSSQNSP